MINTFIIPLLICGFPLILIWSSNKISFIKNSLILTLILLVTSVAIGCSTPFYALSICAQALAENMPAGQPKCLTGAAVFLPIGIIATILGFILGIYNIIHTYRLTIK